MNACSIVLYIITERWPGARKYRDMYEAVKQSVLESIKESQYEPRRTIKQLHPGLFTSMDRNEEGTAAVTAMVADMAGTSVPDVPVSELSGDGTAGRSGAMMVAPMMEPLGTQGETPRMPLSARTDFNDAMFEESFGPMENIDAIHGGFDLIGFEMSHEEF